MRAYHNSRELKFRDPFGAVEVGGAVCVSIDTWDGEADSCELILHVDQKEDRVLPMEKNWGRYTVTFTAETTDIYWYQFLFHFPDGNICRYGPKPGRVGGEGDIYGWDVQCPFYQVTAYVPRKTPAWYRDAIVYQIFPDRFYRGEGWRENAERVLSVPRRGTPKALVEKWGTPVGYKRLPNGRIKVWEFYGGTLSGIREKLDYLRNLGVTALYLNPIFEAASNHRYDTGDYERVDGMLGDEEDFRALCREAEEHGISLILDGVFNHTGCDSRYFNKFENYPGPGACQGEGSPYSHWFRFYDFPKTYECWWGIDDLPDVEEHDPGYKSYIYGGENSIVRRWLRAGAKGWRLDVADELPDDFIEGVKSAVVAEKGADGLLMGEVWEDASNKVAYGQLRRYFLGTELDTVMNYPFRSGVLDFLTGKLSARDLLETTLSLQENYPRENFYAGLNLMGSHDRPRLLTVLGDAPDPGTLTEAQRRDYKLPEDKKGLAKGRLWLLALLQMTLPGVPCIYYGDEAGMEGYADPYNRGPYPWGREDRDCATIYRNAINLRKVFPELVDAGFEPFAVGDDVFGYTRDWEGGALTVAVNRGSQEHSVTLNAQGREVTDVLGGAQYRLRNGEVELRLWPMGSAILYFHPKERLGRPLERGSGVLAHITSLPTDRGPGNIGQAAYDFVDFLHDAGQKYWQILPVNPTDHHGSPYAGASAFAGNVKLLPQSEKELWEEYERFAELADFEAFCKRNARWLEPYAAYMAVKTTVCEKHFTQWPEEYRVWSPELLKDKKLAAEADFQRFCQYKFELAWQALRAYAKSRGVTIIGDMPMFVSGDSADVWAQPEQFLLSPDGRPSDVAGVPPSYMDEGQSWGNPLYDWGKMEKDGFDWWMRRFERMLDLYDYVRLDHFMGFESAWAVPAGKKPKDGRWLPGPGMKLFKAAFEKFGPLPFVAEDLGSITPAIRGLLARCGFLGTDVMQYQNADPQWGCFPAKEKIAYSGTHDNMTLLEFCKVRYPDRSGAEMVRKLKRALMESTAEVTILPLQDVLELGAEARMNTPGTTGRNWTWQAKREDFKGVQERLLSDTKLTNRS